MFNSVKPVRVALVLFGAFFVSSSAMAAGFEKAQVWSAKSAAMAGAVVGSVAGAESLYFNPAGLADSSVQGEISVNFSPTLSKFSGSNPFQTSGGAPVNVDGSSTFSPIAGIVASYKPMPKLGIGVGYYVSGGSAAKFEDLDYSTVNANFDSLRPTVETNLAIKEFGVGAGYEVMPGLRFGLTWRIVKVSGKFSTVKVIPATAISEITIDNIDATKMTAWKLGAQYEEPHHRWGLGLALRTSVSFTATGETSGRAETAAASSPTVTLTPGTAELDNTYPLQLAFGGWTRATELVRLAWEYSFTNYTQDREIVIRGAVGSTALANIPQHWKNMHVIRLGGEYSGIGLPLRFGYAFTSQVTPSDFARSTFSSPGPGHSITFGSGMIVANNIDIDGALEYSFASGTGRNASGETTADTSFKSHAYVAHLSAKYRF